MTEPRRSPTRSAPIRRTLSEANAEGRAQDAIAQVYDASVDDSLWPLALVRIGELADCAGASLQLHSARNGRLVFASVGGFEPEMMDEYSRHYVSVDIRLQAALAGPRNELVDIEDLLDPEEYRRSAVFNEFFGRHDLGRALGGVFTVDENHYAAIGGQRSWRSRPFDPTEKERFAAFAPTSVARCESVRSSPSSAGLGNPSRRSSTSFRKRPPCSRATCVSSS